jgi:hypothetical protein
VDGLTTTSTSTHRRVVQERADLALLHLIEGVDGLDAVVEELVIHERDAGAARELVRREVGNVPVDGRAEVRAELGDDGEHSAPPGVAAHRTAERDELGVEARELLLDALLDSREGVLDEHHQVLWTHT